MTLRESCSDQSQHIGDDAQLKKVSASHSQTMKASKGAFFRMLVLSCYLQEFLYYFG